MTFGRAWLGLLVAVHLMLCATTTPHVHTGVAHAQGVHDHDHAACDTAAVHPDATPHAPDLAPAATGPERTAHAPATPPVRPAGTNLLTLLCESRV